VQVISLTGVNRVAIHTTEKNSTTSGFELLLML